MSIALIDHGELSWTRAFGDASTRTLYQAASMSKLVAAVGALRLVQQGSLDLDRDVNEALVSWHLPMSSLTNGRWVTLRGLLSMTGGIGVPGYLGYDPGAPLPNLLQILDGMPPANSPPVRVDRVPDQAYAYSGGGYEIIQALIEDSTRRPFAEAMQDLLFRPFGMSDSTFVQPPPHGLLGRIATGHLANGSELPGGWRVIPELAAGGLWSTPMDRFNSPAATSCNLRSTTARATANATSEWCLPSEAYWLYKTLLAALQSKQRLALKACSAHNA